MTTWTIACQDEHPVAASSVVDAGLDEYNAAAAPFDEVQPISAIATMADGTVVGGAVGRRWGRCCELQQLWIEPGLRRQGLATRLMNEFELRAQSLGCHYFYLETFSFQAPDFYRTLGYEVEHANSNFPHGIVKYLMVKQTSGVTSA